MHNFERNSCAPLRKGEAQGRGFRTVIAEAISKDMPVLVGLNELNRPAFPRFLRWSRCATRAAGRCVARLVQEPIGDQGNCCIGHSQCDFTFEMQSRAQADLVRTQNWAVWLDIFGGVVGGSTYHF